MHMLKNKGFTLIELLIVVAIIAVLAAIVFENLNAQRRFAETNNARRWSDAASMLQAITTYIVDHEGIIPAGIDSVYTTAQMLGTDLVGCNMACTATTTELSCLDLTSTLVGGGYIGAIPLDIQTGTTGKTDYYVQREPTGVITVGACEPEAVEGVTPAIHVQR